MRVLVTGGSGFLGAHCVQCLVNRGYSVVFTTRSQNKGNAILSNHSGVQSSKLSYVVVEDIAKVHAFDTAVISNPPFDAVIHTASPYHFNISDKQKQLLDPAILGTTGLLEAIKRNAPTVKRVVITSSFAAMVLVKEKIKVYNESYWNNVTMDDALNTDLFTAWRSSKTFAEKAAWDFVEKEKPHFDISTINPPIMYGPIINHIKSLNEVNTSNLRIRDMVQGKMKDGLPPTGIWIWVDVRDVALAHVLALEVPEAAGKRFLVTAGDYSNAMIADAIKSHFPDLADALPDSYVDDLNPHDKPFEVDNTRSREILELEYRPIEQSIVDTVMSLQRINHQSTTPQV